MAVFTGGGGALSRRNGSSTRSRLLCLAPCIVCSIGVLLVLYQVAWMYWLPGALLHGKDTETIPIVQSNADGSLTVGTKTVTRRKPDQLYTLDPLTGQKVPNTPTKAILDGYFTLIDLRIPDDMDLLPTLHEDGMTEKMYSSVTATFCHISWELQNDDDTDPTATKTPLSTFADLQHASILCPGTRVDLDFWDIVHQVRQHDQQTHTARSRKDALHIQPVPSAVIFHESKCGSTLLTNTLAAFEAPHHTRVYVEAPPPLTALQACEASTTPRKCARESHRALLQDVFYMMGRIKGRELPQHVFHKIHSTGVQSMDAFVQAMPTTPWVFVYRNSIEVMMSHFPSKHSQKKRAAPPECLQKFGRPSWQQPPLVVAWVEKVGKAFSQLTREEYCAAHLAGLALAALQEHNRTQTLALNVKKHAVTVLQANGTEDALHHAAPPHWFVNYNTLPYMVWETFLPSLLVHPIGRADIDRMRQAGSVKVHKAKKELRAPEHWMEDSTMKQGTAPSSIRDAVALFLDPIYEQLESIRHLQSPNSS